MKVTGFSFIKNAVLFDYPIKESLLSILPLCDEIIVAVGDCTDGTRELVASLHPTKIKIIDTVWDNTLKVGGVVLADETNKAFKAISYDTDWCFYIQGDEVFHEQDLALVKAAMLKYKNDTRIDGLLFKYQHFYGSFDYVGISSKWYRNEIRVIKNNPSIYSYRDAQGFRKGNDEKLNVANTNASIYHYGWVREPEKMMAKANNAGRYWGGEKFTTALEQTIFEGSFDYSQIDALEKFKGKHPVIMQERINKMNWTFNYDLTYNNLKWKDKLKNVLQKILGRRVFDYQNYKLFS